MTKHTFPPCSFFNTCRQDLLRKFDVNRPVFWGLLFKIWNVGAGAVTLFLIARLFSPALQGFYYTFSTILALQIFVELGLGTVLVQFASHEWSLLNLDQRRQICGDKTALSRLMSLTQLAIKWYFSGALVVIVAVGGVGYLFFIQSSAYDVMWRAPWIVLSLLTGAGICLVPAWSLLEGCNQVSSLYKFRFFQGVCTNLMLWISIAIGLKLWAPVVASTTTLIAGMLFISWRYSAFFKQLLFYKPTGDVIGWRKDLWPMQWKIALSWACGYFLFSLFTPVLFHFHGPIIAGQFGMTWSIVGAIGGISGAWLAPQAPQFGILIARRDFEELNRRFWRATRVFMGVVVILSISCWLFVYALNSFHPALASRLLPPSTVAVLLMAQALAVLSTPFSMYLRAHKNEPLLILSVVAGVLATISTIFFGKYYAATGVVLGYLLVNAITTPFVFLIWSRCRKNWHGRSC
jgi:O-antigen/teichoic acid export membrane protein